MTPSRRRTLLPLVLILAACAPPEPRTAPSVGTPVPRVSLFCRPEARELRFDALGVPSDEMPVSVALDGEHAYVLFTSRLLRVPLAAGPVQAEMTVNRGSAMWIDMALDPLDGSVWIVTDKFALVRVTPGWQTETHQVEAGGEGGFDGIQAARDALYVTPVCAREAVWRLGRGGEVLGAEFPVPEREVGDEPLSPQDLRCSRVRLERDVRGNVVAWDYQRGKVFQLDGEGRWTEADPGFFAGVSIHPPTARGVDVGTPSEQWYVAGRAHSLFYWKGRPAFLGSFAAGGTSGTSTVLILPGGKGTAREALDECGGRFILAAAAGGERYAAITGESLILGETAGAPDLP